MLWRQTPAPSGAQWTTTNRVYLWPHQPACEDDLLQQRSLAKGGISIQTSFYYPSPPQGYGTWEGCTAPLKRWKQTVIEGLTTEPIVLEGYWSQTYRPEHHNFLEHFLFEPRLEPVPSTILDQLLEKNIRYIHLITDNDPTDGDQSLIATYP